MFTVHKWLVCVRNPRNGSVFDVVCHAAQSTEVQAMMEAQYGYGNVVNYHIID